MPYRLVRALSWSDAPELLLAFQAGHAGSIPVARSAFFQLIFDFPAFIRLIAALWRLLVCSGVYYGIFPAQIMSLARVMLV